MDSLVEIIKDLIDKELEFPEVNIEEEAALFASFLSAVN